MKIVMGVRLYSVDEVASMIGISKITALKYIKDHKCKSTKIERRIYLTEEEIRRIVLPVER